MIIIIVIMMMMSCQSHSAPIKIIITLLLSAVNFFLSRLSFLRSLAPACARAATPESSPFVPRRVINSNVCSVIFQYPP